MKRYDVGSKDGLGFFCNGYGREDEHGEWVRAEDAAELEKQLAEARAALRDYSSALNVAYVPDMLQAMYDCERKHATALRAAREAG